MLSAYLHESLSDPRTGAALHGQFAAGRPGQKGPTGTLKCTAGGEEYAVLGGVAVFYPRLLTPEVLRSARAGNFERSAALALMAEGQTQRRAKNILRRLRKPRLLQFRGSPYPQASGSDRDYYRYRYSLPDTPTCIGIASCLNRSGERRSLLLDVGCGYAHFYRYYLRSYTPNRIVLLDKSLEALLTASCFVDPTTLLVCADADNPLPFSPGSFTDIVSFDGFPHLKDQPTFLRRIPAMLDPEAGTLWLTRNPNPRREPRCPVGSLPPSVWRNTLIHEQWRLFPDRHFAEPALTGGTINLAPNYIPRDDAAIWSTYTLAYSHSPWDKHIKFSPLNLTPDFEHLNVNSVYSLRSLSADRSSFTKSAPVSSNTYGNRDTVHLDLPDRVTVPSGKEKRDYQAYATLAGSLVMIETPGTRDETWLTVRLLSCVTRVTSYISRARWFNFLYSTIPAPVKAQAKRLLVG